MGKPSESSDGLVLLGLGVSAALYAGTGLLHKSRLARLLGAATWPLLHPLLYAVAYLGFTFPEGNCAQQVLRSPLMMANYHWAWGVYAIFNPMAQPGMQSLGFPGEYCEDTMVVLFEFYRFPLFFFAQLALTAILAHFARDAVRLWCSPQK